MSDSYYYACLGCGRLYKRYSVTLFSQEIPQTWIKKCEACYHGKCKHDALRLREIAHNPRIIRPGLVYELEHDGFLE